MKKVIYLSLIFLFSIININVSFGYGTFTQTSSTQYSQNVNNSDIITSTNWNSVVLDISNLITDIGSMKTYIDANLVTFFRDDGTTLSYSNKNVSLANNLTVGGKTTTNLLEIVPGGIPSNVIDTLDVKNGTLLQNDLDPTINYGQDVVFQKNGTNLYYDGGNVGIGDITASQKVEINNGSLKIMGTGNGIIFSDGTKLTSKPVLTHDDVLTSTNQTISGNKQFNGGIQGKISHVGNIFHYPIDQASGSTTFVSNGALEGNSKIKYYAFSGGGTARFDNVNTKSGKNTLLLHINAGQYIEVKVDAQSYDNIPNELPKLIPSTTYHTGIYVKTNLTGDDYGAVVRILMHDANGNSTQEVNLTPQIKTVTGWTYYEKTFTTSATTTSGHIEFRIYGHTGAKTLTGDAWFDVNGLTITPVINTNGDIVKIDTLIDGNVNRATDEKTLVTEKAVSDYIATKGKKIDGACGNGTTQLFWTEPKVGLCDIGEPSKVTKLPANNYTWTCTGIGNGNTSTCNTKECVPNMVTITPPMPTSCREIKERDMSSTDGMYTIATDNPVKLTTAHNNSIVKWRIGERWSINDTRNVWNTVQYLPSYLVGLYGTEKINGSNITINLLTDSNVYLLRESTWNSVPLDGWTLKEGFTGLFNGNTTNVYEKQLTAGTYTFDVDSAMYAFKPLNNKIPTQVYCDMTTDGGGWTRYYIGSDAASCTPAAWNRGVSLAMNIGIKDWLINNWDSYTKNSVTTSGDIPYSSNILGLKTTYQGSGYKSFYQGPYPSNTTRLGFDNTSVADTTKLGRNNKTNALFNNTANGRMRAAYTRSVNSRTGDWWGPHNATYSHIFLINHKDSNGLYRPGSSYYNGSSWQNSTVELFGRDKVPTSNPVVSGTFDTNYCASQGQPPKPTIKNTSGVRKYSDGTVAKSCLEYLNPTNTKYSYKGDIGDGVYTINPGSGNVNVYCDMTTDGGGWTLAYKSSGQSSLKTINSSNVGTLSLNDYNGIGKLSDTSIKSIYTSQYRVKENGVNYTNWYCKFPDISNYADNVRSYKYCGNTYSSTANYTTYLSSQLSRQYGFSTRGSNGAYIVQLNYNDGTRKGSHIQYGATSSNTCDVKNGSGDRYGCHSEVWIK